MPKKEHNLKCLKLKIINLESKNATLSILKSLIKVTKKLQLFKYVHIQSDKIFFNMEVLNTYVNLIIKLFV